MRVHMSIWMYVSTFFAVKFHWQLGKRSNSIRKEEKRLNSSLWQMTSSHTDRDIDMYVYIGTYVCMYVCIHEFLKFIFTHGVQQ